MKKDWVFAVNQRLGSDRVRFIKHFYKVGNDQINPDKLGHAVHRCPYCGQQDCFKVRNGFVKCFNASCVAIDSLGFVQAVEHVVGPHLLIPEIERFTGIPYNGDLFVRRRVQSE